MKLICGCSESWVQLAPFQNDDQSISLSWRCRKLNYQPLPPTVSTAQFSGAFLHRGLWSHSSSPRLSRFKPPLSSHKLQFKEKVLFAATFFCTEVPLFTFPVETHFPPSALFHVAVFQSLDILRSWLAAAHHSVILPESYNNIFNCVICFLHDLGVLYIFAK